MKNLRLNYVFMTLCLLACASLSTGCSNNEDENKDEVTIIGSWQLTKWISGNRIDTETISTLTFKEDGTRIEKMRESNGNGTFLEEQTFQATYIYDKGKKMLTERDAYFRSEASVTLTESTLIIKYLKQYANDGTIEEEVGVEMHYKRLGVTN